MSVYRRTSGILLHPTALPGRFGIGDLGPDALRFVEWLAGAGQGIWQILPLGPTGFGDSPYQCFSAFAGNPLLVSPERLIEKGWLVEADLRDAARLPDQEVDFGRVIGWKNAMLRRALTRFRERASEADRHDFESFCQRHSVWLDDFALFMAIKEAHGGTVWTEWEKEVAARDRAALRQWRSRCHEEVEAQRFSQYLFFAQWTSLRQACHAHGVRLMGDIPVFLAHDSADVWAHPELFKLDAAGRPTHVAGVPPDYFSLTGQRWGNPVYRWDTIAATGYRFWVDRVRAVLSLVDIVRLDHFRGFEASWEIPSSSPTAEKGRWCKGPGAELFNALAHALTDLPIVAEDLGVITPEVDALRERFGFPGMAVLQFAFGDRSSTFLPHNHERRLVVYTGTHDNDTVVGWWTSGTETSTRSREELDRERTFTRQYLGSDGNEIHWTMIRAALASVAETTIIPLQDILGLGSEARMNLPGRPSGNWRWRFRWEEMSGAVRDRLRELTAIYDRLPTPPEKP